MVLLITLVLLRKLCLTYKLYIISHLILIIPTIANKIAYQVLFLHYNNKMVKSFRVIPITNI